MTSVSVAVEDASPPTRGRPRRMSYKWIFPSTPTPSNHLSLDSFLSDFGEESPNRGEVVERLSNRPRHDRRHFHVRVPAIRMATSAIRSRHLSRGQRCDRRNQRRRWPVVPRCDPGRINIRRPCETESNHGCNTRLQYQISVASIELRHLPRSSLGERRPDEVRHRFCVPQLLSLLSGMLKSPCVQQADGLFRFRIDCEGIRLQLVEGTREDVVRRPSQNRRRT